MIKVKICGLSEELSLLDAIGAGADYVGFVHYPRSPRHISLKRAAELKSLLPSRVKSVLVIVDPDDTLLLEISTVLKPDYIQLHGNETAEHIAEIRRLYPQQKLIKAIAVSSEQDLEIAKQYSANIDMLLFDAKPSADSLLPGGNGIVFDWNIMKNFQAPLPWILSGGLNADNVKEAIIKSAAEIVDVSSGVETIAGQKNSAKIKEFIKAAKYL